MARYIDENDIYELFQPRGIAKLHVSHIDVLPRADVAPRAEVEELTYKLESLLCHATGGKLSKSTYTLKTMETVVTDYIQESHDEGYAEATTEVAREIFEEIEEHLRGIFDFFRQDNDIRESCAIMFALSEITKLKKKYTGDAP